MLTGRWSGAALRLVLFLLLFVALSILGAAALAGLGVRLEGRDRLLGTAVSLVAAVIVGVALLRWLDHRPAGALGFGLTRAAVRESALGTAIGGGGLVLAALVMLATGKLAYGPDAGSAGAWISIIAGDFAVLAIAAASEEALFRGYPFQVVAERFGPVAATVLSSIGFALAHGANPDVGVFALTNIFLAGVLLAIAYLKTGSLWFATGVHVGWNWAMASLFDLPVSGIAFFDTPLYEPVVGGPLWLTGGPFGPEGGLVGTLGFGVALFAVLKLRAVRMDESTRALRPLMLAEGVDGNA